MNKEIEATYIDEMVKKLCPDGVEWRELGEVSSFYGGLTGKNKSDFDNGNAKYVTYKNIFSNIQVDPSLLETVSVASGENQNSIEYGDILITGSSESKEEAGMSSAVTFYPDSKIYLNSFSFGIRFNSDFELLPEFSKYLFRSYTFRKQIEKTASGVTRYNVSKVAFNKIKVPVLPKKIQKEIVKVLDKLTKYATELTTELTLRNKQYSFYRDKLLSFEDEVCQVEWKTLGEVCGFQNGFAFKSNQFTDIGEPIIRIKNITARGVDLSEVVYFDINSYKENLTQYQIEKGSILIAMSGATTGKIGYYDSDKLSYLNQRVGKVTPTSEVMGRYLYHWLVIKSDEILAISSGSGAQPNLSTEKFKKLKIPVPPLPVQKRIIQVLDSFDTVCNSLKIGLPKEIELRQKQYEYWRDRLFDF